MPSPGKYHSKINAEIEEGRKNPLFKNILFFSFLAVVLLFLFTSKLYQYHESHSNDSPYVNSPQIPDQTVSIGSSLLSVYATNEYGNYDTSSYPYFDAYEGSQLVEPYKETVLQVTGLFSVDTSYSFLWRLEESSGVAGLLTGSAISVTLKTPGLFKVEVHMFDKNNLYKFTYTTHLVVRYVKREIRSLTAADREKFLDAAFAIWQYDTDTGRAKFGAKFTGIHTYVREHSIASEDVMCDQFHDGSGFLTHHLALSNSFEAALRAVDPSVTLPYWDFSMEGQEIANAGEKPSHLLKVTPVFSDTWFGAVDADNHIADSRWAHSQMPRLEEGEDASSAPHNSYGYFRSYWNNNDDPEVVRHMFDVCGVQDEYKPIATCQAVYNVLNIATLAEMQTLTPVDKSTDLHGPMHTQMGGMFGGCDTGYTEFMARWSSYLSEDLSAEWITSSGQNSKTFLAKWGSTGQRRVMVDKFVMNEYYRIFRGLWRSHMCAGDNSATLLQCPEECTVDKDAFEDCACSVPRLTSGETTWENLLPCVVFSETNREYFNKTMSVAFMEDLIKTIASSPVKEGEMIQSSSPADIMFWMVHPVIERVLAAKRLSTVADIGGTAFAKWTSGEDASSELWLSYSYFNIVAGTNKYHPDDYTCIGHGAEDAVLPVTLPFTEALTSSGDVNRDGILSNWEFYSALDPNVLENNDYVFDHFRWDHCVGAVSTKR